MTAFGQSHNQQAAQAAFPAITIEQLEPKLSKLIDPAAEVEVLASVA